SWQRKHGITAGSVRAKKTAIPPPFVHKGYWADYGDVQATFPEDWTRFNQRERSFFSELWKQRAFSIKRTFVWFIKQQLHLLSPAVLWEVGILAYILYWPLQIVLLTTMIFALIRHPKLITGFLSDVRLYLDPQGLVERAIVQRIDYRVGKAFLQMIGL